MGNQARCTHIPLIEPTPIPDTFAMGRDLQMLQGFVRVIYWAEQPMSFGDGSLPAIERHIVSKIILPTPVWQALRMGARRAND